MAELVTDRRHPSVPHVERVDQFLGQLSRRLLEERVALPHDAIEFMKSIGLAAFVAMIGLKAGPVFLQALKEIGITVFLGGMVVTLMPQLVGLLVGRFVLRLNPILLLGALAGAQTMTAGLAAVQERSGSPVAVIGYSSTVAFGHILIAMCGTALVWMLAA